MKLPKLTIEGHEISEDSPPVLVAEIGINHGGSLDEAKKLAKLALNSGIKFIKHQTHIPDDEMSVEAKKIKPGNSNESIYNVISKNSLNEEEELEFCKYVRQNGGIFFSTPFSRAAIERIRKMDLPVVKIGSGECNNLPLISRILDLRKPIILSTGMNSINSVKKTVKLIRDANLPFALLHCTNLYPTPVNLIKLSAINEMKSEFPDAVIGLSDHSESIYPCIASVALGARILEKHFTDSKNRIGPDISCSMTPEEAKELIIGSKEVWQASGGKKIPSDEESVTIAFAFASVVTDKEIKKGETFTPENIWVKRPSGGDFHANQLSFLYGKRAKRDLLANIQIKKEMIMDD